MTKPERLAEIARLEAMLEASRNAGGGYKDRVNAIEQKLSEMRDD